MGKRAMKPAPKPKARLANPSTTKAGGRARPSTRAAAKSSAASSATGEQLTLASMPCAVATPRQCAVAASRAATVPKAPRINLALYA
eukprot:9336943-Pyramimonas_sp.AAC.1